MADVQFVGGANDERVSWVQLNCQEWFEQMDGDVKLAQRIGGYLRSGILQSHTLNAFYVALDEDALVSQQVQHMLSEAHSSPAADRLYAAIYCCWRIEQELRHLADAALLAQWGDGVRTPWLQRIIKGMQEHETEEEICLLLQGFFATMDMHVRRVLKKLPKDYFPQRFALRQFHDDEDRGGNGGGNRGGKGGGKGGGAEEDFISDDPAPTDNDVFEGIFHSSSSSWEAKAPRHLLRHKEFFAEVLWAPRIWCFFVMLRLRHDEDFSRALWDKGFRFVGCDLEPSAAAPEEESWTAQVLSAGVLPDGAGGVRGGGSVGVGAAGVAANPFAEDPNSPEMLVARLLKAEGREVEDEARAADGEKLPALPPLSVRVSKTRQRMRLVCQGLHLIARKEFASSEFGLLFSKLCLCGQSEREAKELLDKETYDILFKAPAVAAKWGRGGTRSAAASNPRTRGPADIQLQRILNDLHDFHDAAGCFTSDWLLQVTVKQQDEHVDASKKGPDFRLYAVAPDEHIVVAIKNLSLSRDISFRAVYVDDKGVETDSSGNLVELKSGVAFEIPEKLIFETGKDAEGSWAIRDNQGKTVLWLRFVTGLP